MVPSWEVHLCQRQIILGGVTLFEFRRSEEVPLMEAFAFLKLRHRHMGHGFDAWACLLLKFVALTQC